VRQRKATLGHHLAQAQLLAQVPTNAQDDDFAIEVPTFEQLVNVPQLTHSVCPACVKTLSLTHRPPYLHQSPPTRVEKVPGLRNASRAIQQTIASTG
jgi:hypothetical protein